MKVEFTKYQGTGNDFVMIDNRDLKIDRSNSRWSKVLCSRKFGVGADGLILIENHANADFEMIYFNPDGSRSFCGNGSRCAVHFANALKMCSDNVTFAAIDGEHSAKIKDGNIEVLMNDVLSIEVSDDFHFLDTGSPHVVKYVEDVSVYDIIEEAKQIRYNKRFNEEGTNVNFVSEIANGLKIRTYERGVEEETLSCGTGATAVALSYGYLNQDLKEVKLEVEGGELRIKFNQFEKGKFNNIWLVGPATAVFKGEIDVEL